MDQFAVTRKKVRKRIVRKSSFKTEFLKARMMVLKKNPESMDDSKLVKYV